MTAIEGNTLAAAIDNELITLFDYRSSKLITKLKGHEDFNFAVAFHPQKKY